MIGRSGAAANVGNAAAVACRASLAPQVPQFFWDADPFLKAVFGKQDALGGSFLLRFLG